MKQFTLSILSAMTMISMPSVAMASASSAELQVVTQYFQTRFSSITGPDSQIPFYIDITRLVIQLNKAGLPAPKAPSTVAWTLQNLGCMRTYANENHHVVDFTPRCVANALHYAAQLDSRIKD